MVARNINKGSTPPSDFPGIPAAAPSTGSAIDDNAGILVTDRTWSAKKIADQIASQVGAVQAQIDSLSAGGGVNHVPTISSATVAVSEEGLTGGDGDTSGVGGDTTNSFIATGILTAADADFGTSFNVNWGLATTTLKSGGVNITFAGENTKTIIGSAGAVEVIRGTINNSGAFTITLSKPVDHPGAGEDIVSFSLPVTVSDGTATGGGGVTVNVEDDAPRALSNAAGTLSDSSATLTGNLLTNDIGGAEGKSLLSVLGNTSYVGVPTATPYGTLTANTDGTWSYVLNTANATVAALAENANLFDVIPYVVKDGDGDTAGASLTITITGAPTVTIGPEVTWANFGDQSSAAFTLANKKVAGSASGTWSNVRASSAVPMGQITVIGLELTFTAGGGFYGVGFSGAVFPHNDGGDYGNLLGNGFGIIERGGGVVSAAAGGDEPGSTSSWNTGDYTNAVKRHIIVANTVDANPANHYWYFWSFDNNAYSPHFPFHGDYYLNVPTTNVGAGCRILTQTEFEAVNDAAKDRWTALKATGGVFFSGPFDGEAGEGGGGGVTGGPLDPITDMNHALKKYVIAGHDLSPSEIIEQAARGTINTVIMEQPDWVTAFGSGPATMAACETADVDIIAFPGIMFSAPNVKTNPEDTNSLLLSMLDNPRVVAFTVHDEANLYYDQYRLYQSDPITYSYWADRAWSAPNNMQAMINDWAAAAIAAGKVMKPVYQNLTANGQFYAHPTDPYPKLQDWTGLPGITILGSDGYPFTGDTGPLLMGVNGFGGTASEFTSTQTGWVLHANVFGSTLTGSAPMKKSYISWIATVTNNNSPEFRDPHYDEVSRLAHSNLIGGGMGIALFDTHLDFNLTPGHEGEIINFLRGQTTETAAQAVREFRHRIEMLSDLGVLVRKSGGRAPFRPRMSAVALTPGAGNFRGPTAETAAGGLTWSAPTGVTQMQGGLEACRMWTEDLRYYVTVCQNITKDTIVCTDEVWPELAGEYGPAEVKAFDMDGNPLKGWTVPTDYAYPTGVIANNQQYQWAIQDMSGCVASTPFIPGTDPNPEGVLLTPFMENGFPHINMTGHGDVAFFDFTGFKVYDRTDGPTRIINCKFQGDPNSGLYMMQQDGGANTTLEIIRCDVIGTTNLQAATDVGEPPVRSAGPYPPQVMFTLPYKTFVDMRWVRFHDIPAVVMNWDGPGDIRWYRCSCDSAGLKLYFSNIHPADSAHAELSNISGGKTRIVECWIVFNFGVAAAQAVMNADGSHNHGISAVVFEQGRNYFTELEIENSIIDPGGIYMFQTISVGNDQKGAKAKITNTSMAKATVMPAYPAGSGNYILVGGAYSGSNNVDLYTGAPVAQLNVAA